ncbi:hypothetical protein C2W64_03459 [Brevibacillus laterosporus]|nr:DNA-binding protein [Brevibacillus laterosporus]RAP22808.1 hypothetical protein C2W64_03459 [Brevibacillus laterosporus]
MIAPKHNAVRSIRSEIIKRLKSHGYTLLKLSEMTCINIGHLSGFLKGNPTRALTVDQLNAIGQAFGEPAGWLYDLYVEECFPKGKVAKRRVRAYLVNCAEIGRHDCIQLIIPRLLEDLKYIEVLFDVAKQLFYKGKQKESIYFYQLVVDNEENSHSERFLMSHYRLFQISEKANTEAVWKAAVHFEPFRKRLSEEHQLEALLRLACYCRTLHKWKEVEKYADELKELAILVHRDELSKKKRGKNIEIKLFNPESLLVVYYGQGHLLKAVSLEKQGLFEEAKEFVSSYVDLSWFELLDEAGRIEVEKFKLLAKENMYRLDVLMGDTSVLADYITFLEDHPEEILSGLVTIVESANKHGFTVDAILDKFSEEIGSFHDYHDSSSVEHHLWFRYQLAIYHFQNKQPKNGVKEILRCMTFTTITNSSKNFIRCLALFEEHRCHATAQQESDFEKILEEVVNNESLDGRPHPIREERPMVIH